MDKSDVVTKREVTERRAFAMVLIVFLFWITIFWGLCGTTWPLEEFPKHPKADVTWMIFGFLLMIPGAIVEYRFSKVQKYMDFRGVEYISEKELREILLGRK